MCVRNQKENEEWQDRELEASLSGRREKNNLVGTTQQRAFYLCYNFISRKESCVNSHHRAFEILIEQLLPYFPFLLSIGPNQ